MKRIGVYCGSFNPIHIGHLAVANYICEIDGVDEVWFVVTPLNPFKIDCELLDDTTRLHLVELAIGDYPRFHASDFEFHLDKPSYTIFTLEALKKEYTDYEFTLIIGADNWLKFNDWHESEKLIMENKILIYPRAGYNIDATTLPNSVHYIENAPIIQVSATFIRESISGGKDVRFFMHPAVYAEIRAKRFYQKQK